MTTSATSTRRSPSDAPGNTPSVATTTWRSPSATRGQTPKRPPSRYPRTHPRARAHRTPTPAPPRRGRTRRSLPAAGRAGGSRRGRAWSRWPRPRTSFTLPEGEPWATVPAGSHREHWPLKTKGFRRWLARRFYESTGQAPGAQALQDALTTLEGRALFEAGACPVYTRVAEWEDTIYYDLADAGWGAVCVTPTGWDYTPHPPVKFRRPRGMLPLPRPVLGGQVDALRPFVNVADPADWRLLVAWLLGALRPSGPYPVLILHGEQGSAKSTTARVLRELCDPNSAPLRSEPSNERDLMIAATNGWMVTLDNLSRLPAWLSDALCRLACGGGFGTRELYSDADEIIFDAARPVVLT